MKFQKRYISKKNPNIYDALVKLPFPPLLQAWRYSPCGEDPVSRVLSLALQVFEPVTKFHEVDGFFLFRNKTLFFLRVQPLVSAG